MDGVVHTYYYSGTKLLRETYGSTVLDFFYDASGTPIAMRQANSSTGSYTVYYYITNLQGDVIRVVNSSGTVVASYSYDPFGNTLSATGSHATINPLRYRGYYYDFETKLYYCMSRYYDPAIGRWISADSFVSTGQGILGYNMFAYCLNNPVIHADSKGSDAVIVIDTDGLGHTGMLVQDENGDWWHFYWGTDTLSSRLLCAVGFDVEPYTWCVEYTGDSVTLEDINKAQQYGGQYESSYYLVGDFSDAVDQMKNPQGDYNLYTNNCSQKSLSILASVDSEYKDVLLQASRYTAPTNANAYLRANIGGGLMYNYEYAKAHKVCL